MAESWPPKKKFLELTAGSDYPQELQKLRKGPKAAQGHVTPPSKRLTRMGYHQWRGPKYVQLHAGRGVYDVPPWSKLSPAAVQKAKDAPLGKAAIWATIGDRDQSAWDASSRFPEAGGFPGPKRFFDIHTDRPVLIRPKRAKTPRLKGFATAHAPYSWTPHHLIPVEAMQKSAPNRPFSDEALDFIVESFWELDNGHNLMLLPRSARSECAHHCLLAHVGSHPRYRAWTSARLGKLDKALKAALADIRQQEADKQKAHDKFIDILVDKLYQAEADFWEKLKELGVANVEHLLEKGVGMNEGLVAEAKKGAKWSKLA